MALKLERPALRHAASLRGEATMLRTTNAARNAAVKQFVEKRRIYNQQLHELRKQWAAEHAAKQAVLEEERKKKWTAHVLERAKKLRLKRIATASKKEEVRLGQEKSRLVFREKLARSQLKINEVRQQQLQRFLQLTDDLNEEKQFWITKDNLETLITPQLFDEPSTTGVVTRRSEFWRWTSAYPNFKRMIAEAAEDDEKFDTLEDNLEALRDGDPLNTAGAHDFLNEIIDSGEDRAKYNDLLKQYLEMQAHLGEDEESDEDEYDSHDEEASDSDNDGSVVGMTEEELEEMNLARKKRREEYITDSEDELDSEDDEDESSDSDVEEGRDIEYDEWDSDDSDYSEDDSDLDSDLSDSDSDDFSDESDDDSDEDSDDGRPTKK